MVGRTLGHYRVLATLGKGGMGEVYQATDTNLNRQVAIKVLPAEFAQDTERLARFEREAKTLATNWVLTHAVGTPGYVGAFFHGSSSRIFSKLLPTREGFMI